MKKIKKKHSKMYTSILILTVVIALFEIFDIFQYFSLSVIKEIYTDLQILHLQNSFLFTILFFIFFILSVTFYIPQSTILTVLAGSLFGFWKGLLVVSFASAIGSVIAAYISRYFLRDYFQKKYKHHIKKINEKAKKDGYLYLFSLRMSRVVPFFIINIGFGLTKMNLFKFYYISQIGMLFGTIIFLNAGTQISNMNNIYDIVSIKIILLFIIMGILPLIIKWIIKITQYSKPTK